MKLALVSLVLMSWTGLAATIWVATAVPPPPALTVGKFTVCSST